MWIIGVVAFLVILGTIINSINKVKGNAYLANKYDEEKKKDK